MPTEFTFYGISCSYFKDVVYRILNDIYSHFGICEISSPEFDGSKVEDIFFGGTSTPNMDT